MEMCIRTGFTYATCNDTRARTANRFQINQNIFVQNGRPAIVIFQSKNFFSLKIASFRCTHCPYFYRLDNNDLLDEFRVKFMYIFMYYMCGSYLVCLVDVIDELVVYLSIFPFGYFFREGKDNKIER